MGTPSSRHTGAWRNSWRQTQHSSSVWRFFLPDFFSLGGFCYCGLWNKQQCPMTLCLRRGTLLCEGSGNSRSYFFRSVPWQRQKNKQTNNFPGLFPAAVFASVVAWRDECTSTTALFFCSEECCIQKGSKWSWTPMGSICRRFFGSENNKTAQASYTFMLRMVGTEESKGTLGLHW